MWGLSARGYLAQLTILLSRTTEPIHGVCGSILIEQDPPTALKQDEVVLLGSGHCSRTQSFLPAPPLRCPAQPPNRMHWWRALVPSSSG